MLSYSDAEICRLRAEATLTLRPFPPARHFAMTADGRMCIVTPRGEVHCDGSYHVPDDRRLR